jgi:hypothetical protein
LVKKTLNHQHEDHDKFFFPHLLNSSNQLVITQERERVRENPHTIYTT